MGNSDSQKSHLLNTKGKASYVRPKVTSVNSLRHPEKQDQKEDLGMDGMMYAGEIKGKTIENIEKSEVFSLLPVAEIYETDPTRFTIDTASEAFNSFKESVKEKGIIQPILTGKKDEKGFPIFSGYRRLLACQQLGIKLIPAVIIPITSPADIYAIQMIADLIRDDLEPLDEAKLYEKYFMARQPEIKLDDMISLLITHERHPERREDEFAGTIPAIINLSGGKSVSTIKNRLCLLRLPDKIKEAIRNKTISVSLGDIFAVHYNHENIDEVFRTALNKKKLTKSVLTGLFETAEESSRRKNPKMFTQCLKGLEKIRCRFESRDSVITESEIDKLLKELEMLRRSLEDRKKPYSTTNDAVEVG
ncbi:MAG: ParB/RepB/Spo0J family partition protein [Smithellaceae bacterium]